MNTSPIAWYCNRVDPAIASIRLRCLQPIAELERNGVPAGLFDPQRRDDYGTVVFSKVYDDKAAEMAGTLRARGRRVVFDICDNHFDGVEGHSGLAQRPAQLDRMFQMSDRIVASTPCLADQIVRRYPDTQDRIAVVPDMLDSGLTHTPRPGWHERFRLARLTSFLERHEGALHLVWMGNSGAAHLPCGLADLTRVRDLLGDFQRRHKLTLTVISNSHRKFRAATSGWPTPLFYLPWSLASIDRALGLHDVSILPITANAFTLGKTINRPATAIFAGLGVIADAIPSFEELRPYIALDDWEGGLTRYAARRPTERQHILDAQSHLRRTYTPPRIAQMWREALAA